MHTTPPLSIVTAVLVASVAYLLWKLLVVRYSTRAARFHEKATAFFLDREHPAGNNK